MLGILLLYICFTANMFIEGAIVNLNHYPLLITGLRIFMVGVILLLIYIAQHRSLSIKKLKKIANISFFKNVVSLYVVSPFLGSWSMQYLDPVKACFIFVLLPFITALMLYFWSGEKLTRYKLYGLFLGFIAIIPIILESSGSDAQQASTYLTALAYLGYTSAVIAFAYGWIVYKEVNHGEEFESELATSCALMFGGLITLSMVGIVEGSQLFSIVVTENFWQLLCLFSLLTAIGYSLYSFLLKHYSATFLSFASFLEPAFGLLYARFFLGQQLSALAYLALGILAIGFYLFYKEELRLS